MTETTKRPEFPAEDAPLAERLQAALDWVTGKTPGFLGDGFVDGDLVAPALEDALAFVRAQEVAP